MRAPDASYQQITQASLGKSIKNAKDPKDRPELFIGDTTYRKAVVKVALRTLGGKDIRVFSMGTDAPVFLVNADDEAVLIAPTTGQQAAFLSLEDIAV